MFNVYGTGIIRFKLLVYDRWGEKIFESNDQLKGWDGNYKNSLCEQGVYTYLINYTTLDRKAHEKAGHINLIR
ncbi:MAG: gliding motility-associated C-terminal domain-containing protein [Sediminibacterium sp.]|nr:gliding motility-associated C-terminal domain-containing protein [Sediminibacterium sp.]